MEHEFFVPGMTTVRVVRALRTPDVVRASLPGWQPDAADASGVEGAEGTAVGRLRLRVGGTTITYRGTVTVAGEGPGFTVTATGTEVRGGGGVTVTAQLSVVTAVQPEPGVTLVWRAEAEATGRLTALEPTAVEAAVRRLLDRFCTDLAANAPADSRDGSAGTREGGAGTAAGAAAVRAGQAGEDATSPSTDEDVPPRPAAGADESGGLRPAGTGESGAPGADVSDAGASAEPDGRSDSAGAQARDAGDAAARRDAPAAGAAAEPDGRSDSAGAQARDAGEAAARRDAPARDTDDAAPEPEVATRDGGDAARGAEAHGPGADDEGPEPGDGAEPGDGPETDEPGGEPEADVVDDLGEPVPPAELDDFELVEVEVEVPESAAALDDLVPPAEAAHARRTMIGRSAEEVDHAPPRGRYAPVPAPESGSAAATLRWAAPVAAALVASAVVVGRVLRRRG